MIYVKFYKTLSFISSVVATGIEFIVPCGEIKCDRTSCVFFEAKQLSLADRDLKLPTIIRNAASGFVRNLSGYRAVGSTVGTEPKMPLMGHQEH